MDRTSLMHCGSLDLRETLVPTSTNILDILEGDGGNEALTLPCFWYLGVEFVDLFER